MSKKSPAYDPNTILNLPNVLMFIRIGLTPILLYILVLCGQYQIPGLWVTGGQKNGNITFRIIATALFTICALTDRYDGIYARKYGQITNVGKIGDPIADKILTGGVMIVLSIISNLPWLITIIILIREWLITAMRLSVLQKVVLPASLSGKIKTNLQMFGLGLYIVPLYKVKFLTSFPQILMLIACIWTVWTGIDYFIKIAKITKK